MYAIPIPRVLGAPGRAVGALVALVALVATLLTVLPTQARAANNPSIAVSGLSLVASSANGVEDPDNTSVKVDEILKLKFAWDARNANAKSGDSFQIQLPEQLRNREHLSEPMKVSHQGADRTIGECVMDDRTITCTFNSTLDTILGQGFTGLQGNGTALVRASAAIDSANVTIDANGKQTEVPVPGGKIAGNVGLDYKKQWMSKWGSDVTSTSKKVDWVVTFGPDQVKESLENKGGSLVVDGKTRSTITFSDQLGPGQAYVPAKSEWKLKIGNAEGRNRLYGQVTDASGADQDTSQGDFDLDVTVQGSTATITVTGPFAPQTNYFLYYTSTPSTADGVIQANTPTGNSDDANSTIASIEPGTGKIRAIAQNTTYEDSQLVFAADAKHGGVELSDGTVGFQPGSTFKALILTEWLKNGHTAAQTVNASGPRTYPPNTFNIPCAPQLAAGSWTVNNVAGTNAGNMTVRDATKQSMNVGFTEMLKQLDVCEVTQFAASIGVTKADGSPLDPDPALALGAKPVPPLSMANVYATFASGGKYCKPIAIESILDASGTSMAVPSADCTQALEEKVADQTATTLQATSEPGGTAKDAGIGRPIAGKTGTTDEAENAWFVGFTPQLSTAVWIGDAKESSRSLVGRTIGGRYFERMYGSDLAVPMWRDYMSQALAGEPTLPIPSH